MLERLQEDLASLVRDRRVIVGTDVDVAATSEVAWLREAGAEAVLVVAGSRGVGDSPETEIIEMPAAPPGLSTMDAIRRQEALRRDTPPEVADAIDAFDPERHALVLGPPFSTVDTAFGGRPVFGARPRAWVELEDKTLAQTIWKESGVAHAAAEVVPAEMAAESAARLEADSGTVWAADNSSGWHGGGTYTRWLGPGDDPAPLQEWFAQRADRVRVMPFLEGIPCSIHGFVGEDRVAAFRPVEMVILRHAERSEFVYGGTASFWDPAPADRQAMRDAARAVGAWLRRSVDYRGPFSIDGVLTRDGFRPTEINPRLSGGFGLLSASVEGLAIGLVVRAYLEGVVRIDVDELEEVIVTAADARRAGGLGLTLPREVPEVEIKVAFRDGEATESDDDSATGTLQLGPGALGGFARLRLDPDRHAPGPSIGPYAVAAASFVAQRWDLPIPALVAAPDVRAQAVSGSGPG